MKLIVKAWRDAVVSSGSSAIQKAASVTAVMSKAYHVIARRKPAEKITSSGSRGLRCITSRSAGSIASESAGNVSVTMLSHRI